MPSNCRLSRVGQSPPEGVEPGSRTDEAPMRTGFFRRLVDRFGSKRLGAASRRVRQPRLAVTDAVKVDDRRSRRYPDRAERGAWGRARTACVERSTRWEDRGRARRSEAGPFAKTII